MTSTPNKTSDSSLPPLRSPCPIVNSLASNNLIPSSGRSIRASQFHSALISLGIAPDLRRLLIDATFLERGKQYTLLQKILNPIAYFFRAAGVRRIGQVDSAGVPVIDLDQVGIHGVVEHDISLSRRDEAQGDNHSKQDDLVKQLLSIGKGDTINMEGLAELRKVRYEQQRNDNPELDFGDKYNTFACSEIALTLAVFGDEKVVRRDVLRAIFEREVLPTEEGWRKREGMWWGVGILKMRRLAGVVKGLVGPVPETKP